MVVLQTMYRKFQVACPLTQYRIPITFHKTASLPNAIDVSILRSLDNQREIYGIYSEELSIHVEGKAFQTLYISLVPRPFFSVLRFAHPCINAN